MSHTRKESSAYRYEVEELRPGTWKVPGAPSRNMEYWHLIVKVNGEYENSEAVLERAQIDLEPIFGSLRCLTTSDANNLVYRRDYEPIEGNCFRCLVKWVRGSWYLDLHLQREWIGQIGIPV